MILVTGASGLLGASLVSLAQEQGREVIGLYHRHPINMDGAQFLSVDLTDQPETCRVFQELRPSAVVHCAAATDVDWCEEHPYESHTLNVMVPTAIAAIAARSNARLLFISTDSVFDGARGNYAETDVPAPVNVYARTKLQGEREVLRQYPMAVVARVNFYGWNAQNKENLAEWILTQLALGRPVPAFSDVIFSPLLANDLAEIILALLDQNVSGLYHVVGSEPISKFEFATRLASTFDLDASQVVPSLLANANLKAQRPLDTSLNTEKVSAAFGRALPDVETGLRRFIQLHKSGYTDRIKSDLAGARK
jgi:dTDP-4-dehydrorhamnose reductase